MAYIEIIPEDKAEGKLAEVYADIIAKRGKLSQVLSIQSLNAESIQKHLDLYMTIMFGNSPLRRVQREMLGVVVSMANECQYCTTHHTTAMLHFWKDEGRIQRFQKDYRTADLSDADLLLCEFAHALTLKPGNSDSSFPDQLRAAGFSDRAILDANLVVSYFNFVNRMVLGLGVQLEAQKGEGFHYD